MTRRDLFWRGTGAAISVVACAAGLLEREGSPLTLVYFLGAILGLVLVVNGKRVAVIWKAERRGHGGTIGAVQARRLRGYNGAERR